MKKVIQFLVFFSLLFAVSIQLNAQSPEEKMGNGGPFYTFGLNAGGAWQDGDVRSTPGGGWGFYMGHSLFNKRDAFFSGTARLRYMNNITYGQNHLDNFIGNDNLAQFNYPVDTNFAHNHRTDFHDVSLELRLNFEKLRRKNRILLAAYAGAGIGIYGTKFDQQLGGVLGVGGQNYDYEAIDYSQSPEAIRSQIDMMQDGEYETNAFGDKNFDDYNVRIMPSIGAELGYWFTPYFALGIGHRTTFTLTDNFDGINKDENQSVNHYTSLNLHWRVKAGKREVDCPDVQFKLPVSNNNNFNTTASSVFITADISNVKFSQINYTINGQQTSNFTYDASSKSFRSNLQLVEGANTIVLQAQNSCGVDGQNITVFYTPSQQTAKQPPLVTITNPVNNPMSTTQQSINIDAQILYVNNKSNVVFKHNGNTLHNFSFNGSNFNASNVALMQGANTFSVQGINQDGSDIKTFIVNYEDNTPKPLPIVNILNPAYSPFNVDNTSFNLSASIMNVYSRNDVQFTINGQVSSNFSFSGSSFAANNINLNPGANTLVVTGTNAQGQDSKSVVIVYQQALAPIVNISYPAVNPFNTNNSNLNFSASVLNVDGRQNITLTVNGQLSTNFTFSNTILSANLNLIEGSNVVQVSAVNNAGQDSKATTIIYRPTVVEQPPMVTITYPRANPFTTQQPTESVMATIENVSNSANVSCTVNGQLNSAFSFSGTSFVLSNLNLIEGNNVVQVSAFNNVGQDSKSTIIIYRPAVVEQPPVVTITMPQQNPYMTQQASASVMATIQNVSSAADVFCTVNGQATTAFTFNGTSFSLNAISLMPGSNLVVIRGQNSVGQDSKSTVLIYEQAVPKPPVVSFTKPNQNPFTTQLSTLNVRATILNVVASNNITFSVNGMVQSNFSFSGTSFLATGLNLNTGANTLTISAVNTDGQDTKSTVVIYTKPVLPKPEVTIVTPNQNPYNTSSPNVNISAVVKNVTSKNDVTFAINGQNSLNFSFSGTAFSATGVSLNTGANTFVITGRNSEGQATASTVVIYKLALPLPTVQITQPSINPYQSANDKINIAATIKNVSSSNDVKMLLNGQNVANFSFSGTSFFASNVSLNTGTNTFVITATNATGQASASTIVIYKPKLKPTVRITSPNVNPYQASINKVTIKALVQHVPTSSGIQFSVNGQTSTNFTYIGGNFTANNVTLNTGINTFVIKASNAAGQATASTVVVYRPAVQVPKPTVRITQPSVNPYQTASNKVNLMAIVTNVSNSSGIQMTLNGANFNNFSFAGTSLSANNVSLVIGANTFVITATNNAGKATASTVVVYKPVNKEPKPTIQITQPVPNPFSTTYDRIKVTAIIKHVAISSDINFLVNGIPTNFSFIGTSFTANNVSLKPGNNTLVITAKNVSGKATASTVVIYNAPVAVPRPTVQFTQPAVNPFNTASQTINVKAIIKNVIGSNNVSFKVNGQSKAFNFSGTNFSSNQLVLKQGQNILQITASNNSGKASASTIVIFKPVVELPRPTVKITSPSANPHNTSTNKINITALVQNVSSSSKIEFKVNGQIRTNFTFNGTTFVANNNSLNPGNNSFYIKGTNNTGSASATTYVVYNPPLPKPEVKFTSPATNPYTAPNNKIGINAKIYNVSSKSQVTFKVNGQVKTNFNFGNNNFSIANVPLNPGANTMTLTGVNSAGQDTKSTVVIYNQALPKPTIQVTSPVQNPWTSPVNKVNIAAVIKHVSNSSGISFTVNGQNYPAFSFSGTSFSASNIPLNYGNNVLTIRATNSAGQASALVSVLYNQPTGSKPQVTITSPANGSQTTISRTNITAIVKNVTSKNNISLKVNGISYNNFSFSGTSLSASNIPLRLGSNTILIVASNGSGQASAMSTVQYSKAGNNSPNSNNTNASSTTKDVKQNNKDNKSQPNGKVENNNPGNRGGTTRPGRPK